MTDNHRQVVDFVRGFTRLVRSARAYTTAHPQVSKDVEMALGPLQAMLSRQDSLLVGVAEGNLVAEGVPLKDERAVTGPLFGMLQERGIASVKIGRGVTRDELFGLVRVLTMRPEEVSVEGHLRQEVTRGFRHVSINELRFAALTDGATEVGQALAEAGVRTREQALGILESYYRDMSQDATPEGVARYLGRTHTLLAETDGEAAAEQVRSGLERAATEMYAPQGVAGLQTSLMRTILAMPPDMRKLVFAEHVDGSATLDVFRLLRSLDPKVRSSALVADLVSGRVSPERLREVIDAMGPTPSEVARLYELASTQLGTSVADPQERSEAISRLFKTLRVRWRSSGVRARGKLLVLDPEEVGSGGYASQLEMVGFEVQRVSDGTVALGELTRCEDVQCILLDVQVPGLSGLELLAEMQRRGRIVPAIVVTRNEGFRNAFEVASYPRLRYFTRPVDVAELRVAIEEFVPQPVPTLEEESRTVPAELKRAQAIQTRLIPASTPRVDGYDLASYYQPAFAVGGDYFDFLPLDHGKIGMIVADVSGKNITGAMVMMMFRSVFRMVAPFAREPKQAVAEVNRYMAKDMPPGMFVTAVYAVFDPATHTFQVTNAGHNPPLLWTRDFQVASFLPMGACPIGLLANGGFERRLRQDEVTLEPGDRLLLYTDGVVEAMNDEDEEFGEKRMLKLVNGFPDVTAHRLVDALVCELDRHRGEAPRSDDITMVAMTRLAS